MSDDNDDVKLSPQDLEKIKKVKDMISQVAVLLQEIPEDVREEYGDLEDCISKAEEIDDLLSGITDSNNVEGGNEA